MPIALPGAKQAQIGLKSVFQIAPRFRQTAAPSVKLFVLLKKKQHILLFRDFPFQVCPENGIFVTSTRRKLIKPIEKNLRKLFVKLQKRQPAKVRQQILEWGNKEENITRPSYFDPDCDASINGHHVH